LNIFLSSDKKIIRAKKKSYGTAKKEFALVRFRAKEKNKQSFFAKIRKATRKKRICFRPDRRRRGESKKSRSNS
jgi:hypothetical protein